MTTQTKVANFLIRISPALLRRVKAAAKRDGRSAADWVRRALDAAVRREAK